VKALQHSPQDSYCGGAELAAANTLISIAAQEEPPMFLFLKPDQCHVSKMKARQMETSISAVRKLGKVSSV
jgi:hypothetical protein